MRSFRAASWGLASLLIAAATSRTSEAADARIVIRGNRALPESVYLHMLPLLVLGKDYAPASTIVSKPADEIAGLVEAFLLRSGYELARVTASKDGETLVLSIDEGGLDKIVIVGPAALSALELRLALALPERVFNRPLLEQRIAQLKANDEIVGARWEVVNVTNTEETNIQLPQAEFIKRLSLLRAGEPRELRIYVEREGFAAGAEIAAGFRNPDGLFGEIGYRQRALFFPRDKLETSLRVGMRLIEGRDVRGNRVGLSRVLFTNRLYTPPLVGRLAAFLLLEGDILGRGRGDLGIDSYFTAPLRVALNLDLEPLDGVEFSLGGGVEQRFRFGISLIEGATVTLPEANEYRPFALLRGHFQFNTKEFRRDRSHLLDFSARLYGPAPTDKRAILETRLEYRRVFVFDYDELRIGTSASYMSSSVTFDRELPLGDGFLRTSFGDTYTTAVIAPQIEYRFALSRDIFKLSLYNDIAIFRADPSDSTKTVEFADALGVGLHVLVIDTFQLSLFGGIGFRVGAKSDAGISLAIQQVF